MEIYSNQRLYDGVMLSMLLRPHGMYVSVGLNTHHALPEKTLNFCRQLSRIEEIEDEFFLTRSGFIVSVKDSKTDMGEIEPKIAEALCNTFTFETVLILGEYSH